MTEDFISAAIVAIPYIWFTMTVPGQIHSTICAFRDFGKLNGTTKSKADCAGKKDSETVEVDPLR